MPFDPNLPQENTPVDAAHTPGDVDSLFVISQSGSYYLTGSITGVAAKHGIKITAPYVTLDLGGFTLTGIAGSLSGTQWDFVSTVNNFTLFRADPIAQTLAIAFVDGDGREIFSRTYRNDG